MKEKVSAELIEKWLNGWSVSRGVSLSVRYKSGFKVDVGWEEQKCRFVFPVLNEDLIHLAESIEEPWVFLKVCAACSELTEILPDRWTVQPQGYLMMSENNSDKIKDQTLADTYTMETEVSDDGVYLIKIKDQNNELALLAESYVLTTGLYMTELKPVSITKEKDWEVTCLVNFKK
ncbi:hypothetical protein ACH34E_18060 [Elizabethkingia anophelis]